MGFRRFMFRGVTKRATNGTLPAPPWTCAGCGCWASRRRNSPAGRPRGEPAVRHGAARERGRRRSAYEAPHGSVAPGPVASGAESKRRRCPRSRAPTSRVTVLADSGDVALDAAEEVGVRASVDETLDPDGGPGRGVAQLRDQLLGSHDEEVRREGRDHGKHVLAVERLIAAHGARLGDAEPALLAGRGAREGERG